MSKPIPSRLTMAAPQMITVRLKDGTPKEIKNGTYSMTDEGESTLRVDIDGYIGWWHDKSELVYRLSGKKYTKIILDITSEGGNPLEAHKMMNYLNRYRQENGSVIETIFTGNAASAATYLALVGNKGMRKALQYTSLLYHFPMNVVEGTLQDWKNQIQSFETIHNAIMSIYEANSTKTREELDAHFEKDIFISAETALEYGFIDEIEPVTYHQLQQINTSAASMTMVANHPQLQNHIQMFEQKIQALMALGNGKYTRADLEGQTEKDLDALIEMHNAAKPQAPKVGWVQRMYNQFTGNGQAAAAPAPARVAVSSPPPAPVAVATPPAPDLATMIATGMQPVLDRLAAVEARAPGHTAVAPQPPGTPLGAPSLLRDFRVGQDRAILMRNMGRREKPLLDLNGKEFGSVKYQKTKVANDTNLNTIEKMAAQFIAKGYRMSEIEEVVPGALDFTEIINEFGAHSTQVMEDVFYDYIRKDNIADVFTVETGIKHRRSEIEGSIGNVSKNFYHKPVWNTDIYTWEVQTRDVHACMAGMLMTTHEFARNYFGRLQSAGFHPGEYPAALMLMEMFMDRVNGDLATAVVNGERDDAVTNTALATHLTMLNGLKYHADNVRVNVLGGVSPIATGAILGPTTGTFHQDILDTMLGGIDERYRDDALVLYVDPQFLKNYEKETRQGYIYTEKRQDYFKPISRISKAMDSGVTMVGLAELAGSAMMVLTPKWNALVSFDSLDDLTKLEYQRQEFCDWWGLAYQAGFNFRRISTRFLAINDQN